MFVVLDGKTVVKLTSCSKEAVESMEQDPRRHMHVVGDLSDLARKLDVESGGDAEVRRQMEEEYDYEFPESMSDAATKLFDKLDEMGFNIENATELTETLKGRSKKVANQVRSLGIKGMKAVGEGFIALGDLLKSAEGDTDFEVDEDYNRDDHQSCDPDCNDPIHDDFLAELEDMDNEIKD